MTMTRRGRAGELANAAPMPVGRASVDVVIVTYNSADDVRECLAAARQAPAVGSVTVVDNDSTDASIAVSRPLADEVFHLDSNVGFGAAQNIGADRGTSPYVLILNPDAVIDSSALDRGVAHLMAHPQVAAVQGEIRRAEDGGLERSSGPEPGLADFASRVLRLRERLGERRLAWLARLCGIAYFADRAVTDVEEVDFLAAVALLIRRDALRDVAGFDERFFLYAEDIDLCARLRGAGWRLRALPGRWAVHVGGASSSSDRGLQRRRWWDAHLQLVDRHWVGPRRWCGWALGHVGRALDGKRSWG